MPFCIVDVMIVSNVFHAEDRGGNNLTNEQSSLNQQEKCFQIEFSSTFNM